MKNYFKNSYVAISLILSLSSTGCATYKTIDNAKINSPKFFSGTRLDLYAIHHNYVALKKFNVAPPKYALIDLPASVMADMLVAPLTSGFAAYEIIMY